MEQNAKKLRAIAYARCSLDRGQDVNNQLHHIREYCQLRGFELVKEYSDYASGAKERRAGLDLLVKDIQRGGVSVLVVGSLDRIARNVNHLLRLTELLHDYNVTLVSLRENLDFSKSNFIGQALLTIIGAISSLERSLVAERSRLAVQAKKALAEKNGLHFQMGRPPKLNPTLVGKINQMRADGLSLRQIAKEFGVSKTSVLRAIQGGPKVPPKSANLLPEND